MIDRDSTADRFSDNPIGEIRRAPMIVRVSRAGAALYMLEPDARKVFPPERLAAFTSFGAFLLALLDERPAWLRRMLAECPERVDD